MANTERRKPTVQAAPGWTYDADYRWPFTETRGCWRNPDYQFAVSDDGGKTYFMETDRKRRHGVEDSPRHTTKEGGTA